MFVDCNNYYSCLKKLQIGIMATKYNFTDNKNRKVIIQLSEDATTLSFWTPEDEGATFWQKMKGPTHIPLDRIKGILYGGTSGTYSYQSKKVLKTIRKQRKVNEPSTGMPSISKKQQEYADQYEIIDSDQSDDEINEQ